MRNSNYDRFPSTKYSGSIVIGWESVIETLSGSLDKQSVVAVDCYTGVREDEVMGHFKMLHHTLLIDMRQLMKPEDEIRRMTEPFMTDDVLFGHLTCLSIEDFFDSEKLDLAKQEILNHQGSVLVVGIGASLVMPQHSTLVYVDMARWEIQQRFRAHEIMALGVDNRRDPVSIQYKRGYFIDWSVLDRYKERLFDRVEYWLDTHIQNNPRLIDKTTFFEGIERTISTPFRVVPFFDPAPWGGQWMKEVCGLDPSKPNYGWCFDCVPEENSLLFEVNGTRFELPSVDLVLLKSRELLGERVESRFGKDFPIRFDFLDTVGGGNLSVQVHPTTDYVHKNFGIHYTQDESYYLLDAKEGASVFLGIKNGVDKDEMIEALREAQRGGVPFDAAKYINQLPAKKHDHYLIPNGTIHCSGAEALVLEISATPNLFTFKLWDWGRLGLDGKPRPINVERGKYVIDWKRNTDYVMSQLANQIETIAQGEGWREERTGLHANEFIETRRHWFSTAVTHQTNHSVNVLNLIEGDEVVVSSPTNAFEPFTVHYAETFIVPASVGEYVITPSGVSAGKECGTIKAYVRL